MTPRRFDPAPVQAKLRAAAVPMAQRDLAEFVRQVAAWLQRAR